MPVNWDSVERKESKGKLERFSLLISGGTLWSGMPIALTASVAASRTKSTFARCWALSWSDGIST